MNGDRTAQQYAEAANEAAQYAASKTREVADAALRMEQTAGRMERTCDDLRRDVRKLESKVAVGFANLKSEPRRQLESFSEAEWEDSPSKVHKIKKVRRATWETWMQERETSADAKRWRKALTMSGKIALHVVMVLVGALIYRLIKGH